MHVQNTRLILVVLLIIPSINTIYAQNSGISATTSKESYEPGDKVVVTGSVQLVSGTPVTIIVRNPMGNVFDVGQVTLMNNLFVHDFVLSDDSQGGTYTINIKHGTQSAQIHFVVNVGQLIIIPVLEGEIKVRSNDTNQIKYENVRVFNADKTIVISMDTSKMSHSVKQEFQIPKNVIDHPDNLLIIKVDEKEIQCIQSETITERILDCPIQAGSKELEIIGSTVIPEFGSISTVVLTVSMLTIMLIFSVRRTR